MNGWTVYYEHKISNQSVVEFNGNGIIDELRLYPYGALMTTYTYEPLIGLTGKCDANNNITHFEYDGFGRLLHVRDIEGNILKKYEYKLSQSFFNCTNTTASWQVTGIVQCIKNSNNSNTGDQEREERDMNNCSPSYYQTRWIFIGQNSAACPAASNCTGIDKRVINGNCETGVRVIIGEPYWANGVITCTYRYEWSDGYYSPNYQGTGNECS